MAAMEWTDKLALGLEPMDKTHVEFVDAYNRLLNVSGAELLAAMDAFIEHSVEHFEQENAWMAKIGFPGCHKAEHDRVLAVCRDVRKRMERGDAAIGRRQARAQAKCVPKCGLAAKCRGLCGFRPDGSRPL